jgi:hypothetical protein
MCYYIRDRDKGDPRKRSPFRGNCKTVSRKQALETGAEKGAERAVCATSRNSERETRLVG